MSAAVTQTDLALLHDKLDHVYKEIKALRDSVSPRDGGVFEMSICAVISIWIYYVAEIQHRNYFSFLVEHMITRCMFGKPDSRID
jgi:hypothetical protein